MGRQPTENRHRYVVLRFDFSTFDDTLETLQECFEEYCQLVVRHTLERNRDLFPEVARHHIRSSDSINGQLNELFLYADDHGIPHLEPFVAQYPDMRYGYVLELKYLKWH